MSDTPPRNDAAMADILASIRRIVAEEDKRTAGQAPPAAAMGGDVFELTPEMRVGEPSAEVTAALLDPQTQTVAPSIDEAAVADVARTVLREELNGALGMALTQNIRKLIREEVARALAERR